MKSKLFIITAIALTCMPICLAADDKSPQLPPSDMCGADGPKPCNLKIRTPPGPLSIVRPDYPVVKKKKQYGVVHLEAIISESGDVSSVSITDGSYWLAQSAAEAVWQWRYTPATVNGVPVEFTHEVTIDFTKDQGVLLGADDLAADLPLQPSEDLIGMLRRGDLYSVGGTVKAPRPIYNPDPDYSALARKNDFTGVCTVGLIVGSDGRPRSIWLIQPIGYGLDQSAIDAVTRWKFEPATRNGTPVAVLINVQVEFRHD